MIEEYLAQYYFEYVYIITILVDTAKLCDVIFCGHAFTLISERNESHVMYFQPMKITKIMYNIIIFIEVFIVIILSVFICINHFQFSSKIQALWGIRLFISDSFLLENLHCYLINLTKQFQKKLEISKLLY